MELQKTAMQQLIDKIKIALEDHDLAKTEYGNGYTQCLISMQNDIEMQMLSIEKKQLIDFHVQTMKQGLEYENETQWQDGYIPKISHQAEKYYLQTFKNN